MTRRQFAVTLVVVLLAGLVGGALAERLCRQGAAFAQEGEPQVVQAERFVLVDGEGKAQAVLGTAYWGGPQLEFFDSEGNVRLGIAVKEDGNPAIGLLGKDDQSWPVLLHLTGDPAVPSLSLSDPLGNTRVTLAVTADGDPQLVLSDANDVGRVVCAVAEGGAPEITLRDGNNEPFWFAP